VRAARLEPAEIDVDWRDLGLGDANVIAVLIVFIVVCLLALNVNVITPDASLAIRPFGPYP
jgi:hypothetical protein